MCLACRRQSAAYVSFSCDVTVNEAEEMLIGKESGVAAIISEPRDGVGGLLTLRKTVTRAEESKTAGEYLAPGARVWPEAAVSNKLRVFSVDLGQRHGAATKLWETTAEAGDSEFAWKIGLTRNGGKVFAAPIYSGTISLHGDDERLPAEEEQLRNRLRGLRTRLNLQKALLQVARLLTLEHFEQRRFTRERKRPERRL